jgi:hypothetical protein
MRHEHDRHDRRSRAEVRWFVAGDVGTLLVDQPRPHKQRVDAYHLGSLTEVSAWKRRGPHGRLEHKLRTGAPNPVVIGGISAFAERWAKRHSRIHPHLPGPWIDVAKQIWIVGGIQLTRVDVDATIVWTISVSVDEPWLEPETSTTLERWVPLLRTCGFNGSYPAWLLARCEDREPRLPVHARETFG